MRCVILTLHYSTTIIHQDKLNVKSVYIYIYIYKTHIYKFHTMYIDV